MDKTAPIYVQDLIAITYLMRTQSVAKSHRQLALSV